MSEATTATIDVLLVDDEALIRAGLRAIIDAEPDLRVVGEADDGTKVVQLVRDLRPDVVLMDVRMPTVDGIEATREVIDRIDDPPKVLVVTTFENDEYVYDALRAGASGFLLKRARPDDVVHAVRLLAGGESLLFPDGPPTWWSAPNSPNARRASCGSWPRGCPTPRWPLSSTSASRR